MSSLCRSLDISCGYLIGKHHEANSGTLLAGGGPNFAREMFSLYDQYYAMQDPYLRPLLVSPRTGYVSGDSLYERKMLVKSEIYNDFLRRYELESTNRLMATCSSHQLEGISLWRSPHLGPLHSEAQTLLVLLLPHLQLALRLRGQVMLQQTASLFTETTLHSWASAALLVTSEGRIRHLNNRAAHLLGEKDGLASHRGRIVCASLAENAQLQQLLSSATSDRRERAVGGAMRIRRSTGSYLDITVIPAPHDNQLLGAEQYAVIFLIDTTDKPASRGHVMKQLYGLTPTESKQADLLLQGFDIREIAERMRITLGTARFHLKRVLAKTGTRRQAQLMRLMLTLPADSEPGTQ